MGWKVKELVRIRERGIGKGFYTEKDWAIANILRVSTLREHQSENTARRCLVTNKENNAIVHTPWGLPSRRHNQRPGRPLFRGHRNEHQAFRVSYSVHLHDRQHKDSELP